MNIAWFTPISKNSAIGSYSALALEHLARDHEVTAFASDAPGKEGAWLNSSARLPVLRLDRLTHKELMIRLRAFDIAIYNIGNHFPNHRAVYETHRAHPGIVILHDVMLHHFFAANFLEHQQSRQAYLEHLEYCHGKEACALSEQLLDTPGPNLWEKPEGINYPMTAAAVHQALGVIVHTQSAFETAQTVFAGPTLRVDLPSPEPTFPPRPPRGPLRPGGKVRLFSFGQVNPNKLIDQVIQAIGQSSFLRQKVEYRILGHCWMDTYQQKLNQLLEKYELHDVVTFLGPQSRTVLFDHLYDADLVINLRHPHFGEGSWSLVETLLVGKPTVVWRDGFYNEFSDDVVTKVASVEELTEQLERLVRDEEGRRLQGQAAADLAKQRFDTPLYCRRLTDFVHTVRTQAPAWRLVDFMSDVMREVGAGSFANDPLVSRVEKELKNLMVSPDSTTQQNSQAA